MARRRGSEERRSFWRMALQMQRESGLPMSKFCEREGLSPPSFYAWRRKLDQEANATEPDSAAGGTRSGSLPQLLPVRVIAEQHDAPVEIVTPEGFVVRVHDHAATDNARRVLQLLQEVP